MVPFADSSKIVSGVCVRFEHAHLVFLDDERRRYLHGLKLLSHQAEAVGAAEALMEYLEAVGSFQRAVWQLCLTSVLTTRGKRRGTNAFDAIPADQLSTLWPFGPLRPHEKYEWIEICGNVPPWLKVVTGNSEPIYPEFQHLDDYSIVSIRNFTFRLGAAQAGIIRVLHDASFQRDQTLTEGAIRVLVQFNSSIPDLFRRDEHWPELIQRVGKATYRLNLHSDPSWMDVEYRHERLT